MSIGIGIDIDVNVGVYWGEREIGMRWGQFEGCARGYKEMTSTNPYMGHEADSDRSTHLQNN